jgi:pimeloyl-ACP methyl ester carboxylesterase
MEQLVLHDTIVAFTAIEAHIGGEAPALLFLHGWRSEAAVWNTFMRMVGQGRNCYALDLPGFGSSPTPKNTWELSDYAQVVSQFIAKKNLTNVILIGHSFGGRVAIKLAAQKPAWLKKLVLIGVPGARHNGALVNFISDLAKLFKPLFKPQLMQPLRRRIYKSMGAEDYLGTPELQHIFVRVINEDLAPLLPNISVPTLIIWGRRDGSVPLVVGQKMAKEVPAAQLVVIDKASHYAFIDAPEECARAVQQFI